MSKDLHEVYQKIKELAIELEKTPTRVDLVKAGISDHFIRSNGGVTPLITACGLEPASNKKIDNSIFNKNIEKHIEEYTEREAIEPYAIKHKDPKIAIISDTHFPFVNKKLLKKFYEFIKEHQPNFIIINGDLFDMYCHSKYPRSHNVYTPRDEENLAKSMIEEFWKTVKGLCKNAKCFILLGNHDVRPLKRVLESYPAAEDWVKDYFKKLFTYEGVETIFDYRQELKINDDLIFHGYRSKLGDHRDYTLMNCFVGHTHHGGTVFRRVKNKTIFECNSGVAGDIESKGLAYTPIKTTTQTAGFAYRDKWGPRFIPVY